MWTIEKVIVRQGRKGKYCYDRNNNLIAVDDTFCEIPEEFLADQELTLTGMVYPCEGCMFRLIVKEYV